MAPNPGSKKKQSKQQKPEKRGSKLRTAKILLSKGGFDMANDFPSLKLDTLSTGLANCMSRLGVCRGPSKLENAKTEDVCGVKSNYWCGRCGKVSYCGADCRKKDLIRHMESDECVALENVEIVIDEDGLASLKTTRDMNAGETLFVEKTLLALPDTKSNDEELMKAPPCYSCHKTLPSTYTHGCTSCGVSLCGYDCETTSSFHELECSALKAMNLKVKQRGKSVTKEFLENEYMDMSIFRAMIFFRKPENLEKWEKLNMLIHSKRFKRMESIKNKRGSNPNFRKNFSLMYSNNDEDLVQRVADLISTFGEKNALIDEDGSSFKGIFLYKSAMRQSCSPNTVLRVEKDGVTNQLRARENFVIQAVKKLPKGTTITFNFSDVASNTDKLWDPTIIRLLSSHESIECDCKRCNDPEELGTGVGSQKCMDCAEGYFIPRSKYLQNDASEKSTLRKSFESYEWHCNSCSTTKTYQQLLDKLEEIQSDYDKIMMNCFAEGKLVPLKKFIDNYSRNHLHSKHSLILKAKAEYVIIARKKQFWDCGYNVDQSGRGHKLMYFPLSITPFPLTWNERKWYELQNRLNYVKDCFDYLRTTGQWWSVFYVICLQEIALINFLHSFHKLAERNESGDIGDEEVKNTDVLNAFNEALKYTKAAETDYTTFFMRHRANETDYNIKSIQRQSNIIQRIKLEFYHATKTLPCNENLRRTVTIISIGCLRIPLNQFCILLDNDESCSDSVDCENDFGRLKMNITNGSRKSIQEQPTTSASKNKMMTGDAISIGTDNIENGKLESEHTVTAEKLEIFDVQVFETMQKIRKFHSDNKIKDDEAEIYMEEHFVVQKLKPGPSKNGIKGRAQELTKTPSGVGDLNATFISNKSGDYESKSNNADQIDADKGSKLQNIAVETMDLNNFTVGALNNIKGELFAGAQVKSEGCDPDGESSWSLNTDPKSKNPKHDKQYKSLSSPLAVTLQNDASGDVYVMPSTSKSKQQLSSLPYIDGACGGGNGIELAENLHQANIGQPSNSSTIFVDHESIIKNFEGSTFDLFGVSNMTAAELQSMVKWS